MISTITWQQLHSLATEAELWSSLFVNSWAIVTFILYAAQWLASSATARRSSDGERQRSAPNVFVTAVVSLVIVLGLTILAYTMTYCALSGCAPTPLNP